jgi:hypothetical protein
VERMLGRSNVRRVARGRVEVLVVAAAVVVVAVESRHR